MSAELGAKFSRAPPTENKRAEMRAEVLSVMQTALSGGGGGQAIDRPPPVPGCGRKAPIPIISPLFCDCTRQWEIYRTPSERASDDRLAVMRKLHSLRSACESRDCLRFDVA
jgi:hypothetical protein